MSPMGQKLRFRAARHPCVIVRSTPVSRPSKGGPAWLLSARSRHGALRQLTMYAITLAAISGGRPFVPDHLVAFGSCLPILPTKRVSLSGLMLANLITLDHVRRQLKLKN